MSDLILLEKIPEQYRHYIITPKNDAHLVQRNYKLKINNEMETSRGVAWTGTMYSNKKIVCKIENGGSGGCNEYTPVDFALWETFKTDARVAFGEEATESTDSLCQYIDLLSLS